MTPSGMSIDSGGDMRRLMIRSLLDHPNPSSPKSHTLFITCIYIKASCRIREAFPLACSFVAEAEGGGRSQAVTTLDTSKQ